MIAEKEIVVTEVDYYSIKRFSNSGMSHFKKSPRHYLQSLKEPKQTAAMLFGSAFHCYVLENEIFLERFFVLDISKRTEPDKAMNSKLNIAWKAEQCRINSGKDELTADDLEQIKLMRESLYENTPAREILDSLKEVEKPLFWKDDITGVELKCKMDGVNDSLTLDLKTCRDASPDGFNGAAYKNFYHRQAALYTDARGANKLSKGDFYFIAIEKEPPYAVSVFKCSDELIKNGRQDYYQILEDYKYWIDRGSPDVGYEWRNPFGYFELSLPSWIK